MRTNSSGYELLAGTIATIRGNKNSQSAEKNSNLYQNKVLPEWIKYSWETEKVQFFRYPANKKLINPQNAREFVYTNIRVGPIKE